MAEEIKKLYTLCVIYKSPMVLLAMKKRGWGAGRWNGYGGKVQEGEGIEEAAKREIYEEATVKVADLVPVGIVQFRFKNKPGEVVEVHIFSTGQYEGDAQETEEMKPQWFSVQDVPFAEMWEVDRHWLPLLFEGKKFRAQFWYEEGDKLVNKEIEIL